MLDDPSVTSDAFIKAPLTKEYPNISALLGPLSKQHSKLPCFHSYQSARRDISTA